MWIFPGRRREGRLDAYTSETQKNEINAKERETSKRYKKKSVSDPGGLMGRLWLFNVKDKGKAHHNSAHASDELCVGGQGRCMNIQHTARKRAR